MTATELKLSEQVARKDFPNDFVWGCATSAYQIEGAANCDGKANSIWDDFCRQDGAIRDASNGDIACDHYHRWREDSKLMQELGLNSYRFSIAWSRILPQANGQINQAGLDFYKRLSDDLLERGIQPWATLYHWDLPSYLQQQGGWKNRATVDRFVDYADIISRALGDRVQHWMTHNEPWCTAMLGHADGIHAPGLRDFKAALQVSHHVMTSHGLAIPAIRANSSAAKVGIALNLHPVLAASNDARDQEICRLHDGLRNRWYLDPLYGRGYPADVMAALGELAPTIQASDLQAIAYPMDFLGVNFYFPEIVRYQPGASPLNTEIILRENVARTDMGWEICPQMLPDLLARLQRDYQPQAMYITENGCSYDDQADQHGNFNDYQRRDYVIQHLEAIRNARSQGVRVQGYFLWSLLDNFEWAEGYSRRFGICHVDFATQKRSLKASGKWYQNFLQG